MPLIRSSLLRIALIAGAVTLVATAGTVPASANPPPARAEKPALSPRLPAPRHFLETDQMPAAKLVSKAPPGSRAAAQAAAAAVAPFLTRPYWGPHYITSVFDHCHPDYTHDGRICEFDGTVALASNGVDPSFSAGYAITKGGTDYLYYDGHNGWDLGLNYEPLMAAAPGVVSLAGSDPFNGGFGLTVTIDHPNGFTTRYAHMSQISVSPGQAVKRGQPIGVSGNTGASTGAHLHFGVYVTSSWTAIDPWGWTGATSDPWPADSGNLWLTGNPADPVPSAPRSVAAAVAGSGVKVTWAVPAFDAGGINAYTVTPHPSGAAVTVPGSSTSAVFTSLSPATQYTFTVTAAGDAATSAASDPSNPVVPPSPLPPPVIGPLASPSPNADFDVSWSAPWATGYDVTFTIDGGAPEAWHPGTALQGDHFWGVAGHTYAFQVTGHAAAGDAVTAVSSPVSVPAGARTANPFAALYLAQTDGGVTPVRSLPDPGAPVFGWSIGRAAALLPDGSGGYELDGWGGLHPFGSAPVANNPLYFGWDIARDLVILPGGTGGYILDGWGGLHPFAVGTNPLPPAIVSAAYWPGWDIAHRIAATPDGGGGYVLDGWGGMHPFGSAPEVRARAYFGWDIARAIAVNPVAGTDGTVSGVMVDGFGGMHPWSSSTVPPPDVASEGYWAGHDLVVGISLNPASSAGAMSGYKVTSTGELHPFGGAPALQAPVPTSRVTGLAYR